MDKLRLRFEKTGRAIWISHLDLMRTLQRGFSRAGISLAYSEGFNPHPLMSIALPLSVGMESVCEILDVKIEGKFDAEQLNLCLPEGIRVLEAYRSEQKASEIRWLEISGETVNADADSLNRFFAQDSIVISKKTKRGVSDTDIRPMIREIRFEENRVHALISAQNPTLNPNNLLDAISQLQSELLPERVSFRREEIYDSSLEVFR